MNYTYCITREFPYPLDVMTTPQAILFEATDCTTRSTATMVLL